MNTSRWITIAALGLLLSTANSASAFDGLRKGFVLGGGAGLGGVSYTQDISGGSLTASSDREGSGAVVTTFKIGLGLNERTLLIYQQNQNWVDFTNAFGNSVTVASGSGVIAVNHYLSEEGGLYLVGGLGVATWDAPFKDNVTALVGGSILVGLGIHFATHWSVEFDLSFGNPSDTQGGVKLETKATNFSATVVGLAF